MGLRPRYLNTDGEWLLQSSKKYLIEVPLQLELAPECQAHSEDQICIVNGFTVRKEDFTVRKEDHGHRLCGCDLSMIVCGIQLQVLGERVCVVH